MSEPEVRRDLTAGARPPLDEARVALVHYWLVGDAGGEKVVREILAVFPQADVFTLVHDPRVSPSLVGGRPVKASWLQRIPGAVSHYRKLLPLMPMALEGLDLTGYDLVLSSESGPAKGVIPPLDALHLCYCHSPMRYLWDQAHQYRADAGRLTRAMMTLCGPALRQWDYIGAQRVDAIAANSEHVRKRIRRYWKRDAAVIHPPVDIGAFVQSDAVEDFYLIGGRHVGYKRIDIAIAAANASGRRLVITGDGPETGRLRRMAGPTVSFRGRVEQSELVRLYATCRAFLMPGEEDFGITPIEAMASGRPVVAYGRGGACDSVLPGVSGLLFDTQSPEALNEALDRLEATLAQFEPRRIRAHADRFSAARFRAEFGAFVARHWAA